MPSDSESTPPAAGCEEQMVDADSIPVRGSLSFREAAAGGQQLLFDADSENLLLVNKTGRAILELCDGNRTIGEIVDHLADQYTVPTTCDLKAVVSRYVGLLTRCGLVSLR